MKYTAANLSGQSIKIFQPGVFIPINFVRLPAFNDLQNLMKKSILTSLLSLLLMVSVAKADVTQINAAQLQVFLAESGNLVDIRRPDEWQKTGVISGSIPLTFFNKFGAFDGEKWLVELNDSIQKDKPIILICHAGVRSKWVADWLDRNNGSSRVYDATIGIKGWIEQGYVVEKIL
jgi:rhodanese-related sulfurtransferase